MPTGIHTLKAHPPQKAPPNSTPSYEHEWINPPMTTEPSDPVPLQESLNPVTLVITVIQHRQLVLPNGGLGVGDRTERGKENIPKKERKQSHTPDLKTQGQPG